MPFPDTQNNILHDHRWREIRSISPAVADLDLTDPANLATLVALVPVAIPKNRPTGGETEFVAIATEIYNSDDEVLARATMEFDLVVYELIAKGDVRGQDGQEKLPPSVQDSVVLSTRPKRKTTIAVRSVDRFMIGVQNITNPVGSLDRIRVFYRIP